MLEWKIGFSYISPRDFKPSDFDKKGVHFNASGVLNAARLLKRIIECVE